MLTCEIKTEPNDGKNGTVSISLNSHPNLENAHYSHNASKGYGILTIPDIVTRTVTNADGSTTIEQYDVVAISNYGFKSNNKNIGEFVLPNTLKKIGTNAFFGFSNLKHISIPETVEDIPAYAFENCTGLKTITLNEGLKEIGPSSFSGCTQLESITIPDSVIKIYSSAFQDCTSLANFVLGSEITYLGEKTFNGCTSLKDLVVPKKLTSSFNNINWNSNHGSSYLENIIINESDDFVSIDGIVYTKDMSKLVYCPPAKISAIVPDGVETIGSDEGKGPQGFNNCRQLTSVTLPEGLKKLNVYSFWSCEKLPSIEIPDTVTEICNDVFANCKNLEKISANSESIGGYAFSGCTSLSEVDLSENLESIGKRAFENCTSLKNLHLPHGLTSIGESAFYYCTSLERIEIPATTTTIGKEAFFHCTNLLGVDLPDAMTIIEGGTFYECSALRTFVVPSGVKTIKEFAFANCGSLVSIEFQNNVETIDYSAFDSSMGHSAHAFFNINSDGSGHSESFEPYNNVDKIKNRTYIGECDTSALYKFTFYEYTGTEADVRYNIRYYTNGGYNDFGNPPDIKRGDTHTLVYPLARDGYIFNGWYADPGFTNKIECIDTNNAEHQKNIRLYASWTSTGEHVETHKLIIKFRSPEGTHFDDIEYIHAEGVSYSHSITSPEGYVPNPNYVQGVMGSENIVKTVDLVPKEYTVTLNTGKPIESIPGWTHVGDGKFTSKVGFGSTIELPTLSYGGLDCKWSPSDVYSMPAHDVDFTAEWQHILTLDFSDKLADLSIDGWKNAGEGKFTKGLFCGDPIECPSVTSDGYYVSWPSDVPTAMPDNDCTITAVVEAKLFMITISFISDCPNSIEGWEFLKDESFQRSFEYGSQLELPESDNPELKIVWSPEPPATMPAENLKFTGKWETYEITIMIEKNFPSEIDGWKHNGRGVYSKVFEYGSGISLPQGDIPGFISWGDGVIIPETMPAHDLSFTAVQKNLYHIALPSGTGYTIEAMPGYDPSTVWAGDKFEFRIVLNPSYNKSSPVIKVGDMVLEPVDGVYTIADVGSDLAVTVSGIKANPSSGGGSGGSSTPTTPSKPDVKVDEDGTKTTTEKGSDGSVTETVEKTDGSTTVTKTEKDGSKTETTTSADGSKKESTLTKTDTGTIETEKNFDSEGKEIGSVEKKTETIEHDSGTMSSETIKTKDSEGTETVKKKLESSDGSLSISIDASIEDGKVSLKTEISIDIAPGTDVSDAISDAIDRMASGIKDDVTDGDAEASHSMKIITKDETATISADSFAKISDLGMKASFDMGVGTVEFDSDISKKLSESKGPVGISMVRAAMDALSDAKRASVGDRPAFEITAESDGESIHELGGTARITLAYELPAGVSASDVRAFYVDDDGIKHMMDTVFDALTGKLSFTTPHFSLYVIGTVADADVSSEDDRTTIYVCAAVIVAAVAAVAAFVLCRKS